MRCVEANPHRQVTGLVEYCFDLFKPRTHGRTHSRRVFDEDSQPAELYSLRSMAHALSNFRDCLFPVSPKAGTRMGNEEIRAERYRADQFIMKRLDRPRAHHSIRTREIDQIIVVNDERSEAKLRPARPEPRRIRLRNARAHARPHARARGKNLQRIRAELHGGIERPRNVPRNRSVDPDAETTILPGRRLGNRVRFRTVFVAFVVGGFRADQWVSHSLSTTFR